MPVFYLSADDIECCYGYGEFAYAAEVMAEWLAGHGIHDVGFDMDTTHPDLRSHTFIVRLPAVSPQLSARFGAWLSDQHIEILKTSP